MKRVNPAIAAAACLLFLVPAAFANAHSAPRASHHRCKRKATHHRCKKPRHHGHRTMPAGRASPVRNVSGTAGSTLPASSPTGPFQLGPNRGSILAGGQALGADEYLLSSDRHYRLVMQGDGNLVEYVGGRPLWSSGTNGNPGAHAVMQDTDGNLVVYSAQNQPLWASNPTVPGAYLALQPDANLVLYSPSNAPLWSSGGIDSLLNPGETLSGLQSQSSRSPDGHFILVMQGDGNLVLYGPSGALWSSSTGGNPGAYVGMQGTDGNLVVYSAENQPLWSSGTAGSPGSRLAVQSDGNVVIYSPGGTALWATDTAGGPPPAGGQGQAIVNQAAKWAGTQYCWAGGGTNGPTHGTKEPKTGRECASGTVGFDCTGLTLYAVHQVTGVVLPHGVGQDSRPGGTPVAKADLQPGDIVFFGPSLAEYTHAGIYAGNGRMWDAQDYGVPVQMHNLYGDYVGATRYWH